MTPEQLEALGTEYLTQKDYANALKTYLQAAELGNYLAMYNIACMYYFGDGVQRDEAAALSWYRKAWQHGDAEAANRAGMMLERGLGAAASAEEAFAAYLDAAQMGSLGGMANVALCYLEGKGTREDAALGLQWMVRASEGGNGIASLLLGQYAREGRYLCDTPDYAQAKACFERGVAQQYAPAALALAELYENGLGCRPSPRKAEELRALAKELENAED